MTYDLDKRAADLERFGTLDYDRFREIVSRDFFEAVHIADLSVSVGKGLLSEDELKAYLSKLAWCFLV